MLYIPYLFMLSLVTLSFRVQAAPLARNRQHEARSPISSIDLSGPGPEFRTISTPRALLGNIAGNIIGPLEKAICAGLAQQGEAPDSDPQPPQQQGQAPDNDSQPPQQQQGQAPDDPQPPPPITTSPLVPDDPQPPITTSPLVLDFCQPGF
ncbi:hypothetical protein BDN72DRAFT_400287 [Pluteus cervinus]|uniref:Uncharacterized protein n=1 Tax=Pluteus cervinus TaxID=181527 RepID=A0ACD3B257_9AGAR|nr:hypothetical protein BDN72DRAFT_400287 [Pluteus cervinus]